MLDSMKPELRAYLTSERFIHENIIAQAEKILARYRVHWKNGAIRQGQGLFFTWPAVTVQDDRGRDIEGTCAMYLPEERAKQPKAMRDMVIRTSAYALFLIEQRGREIKAILESTHGTRTWTIPLELHGDVHVLGQATQRDDYENVGLLWDKKKSATA
jgi:hypothetical protein